MDGHVVFFTHRHRHSALRMDRTTLKRMPFRQHHDTAGTAQLQRCAETGHTAPNDQEVGLHRSTGSTRWHELILLWRTCGIGRGLSSFHTEGRIALNTAQQNRLCSDPLQSRMASLTEARILRILFP